MNGYKKEQEIIENKINQLEQSLQQSNIVPKKTILGKETVDYEKYKELEQAYKLQKAQNSALSEENTALKKELKSTENEYNRFRDFIFTILKKLHLTKFYEKLIEKKYLENILPEDVDDREYLNELNKAKESLEKLGKRRRYYRRDEHDIEL